MKIIGITGRSGCGKSTVTAVFAAHGIPCYDGDQASRDILLPGSPCLAQLAERFGTDILRSDGTLDRRLLADRAFRTPEGTAALTAITHPAILQHFAAARAEAEASGAAFLVLDGAAIVGTPFASLCDRLVVVTAPHQQSVARICQRDGIAPAMAERRLAAQTEEAALLQAATDHIRNDSTREQLAFKAEALYARIREECNAP